MLVRKKDDRKTAAKHDHMVRLELNDTSSVPAR